MRKIEVVIIASLCVVPAAAQQPTAIEPAVNSVLLGPDGQNVIPFGTFRSQDNVHTITGSHSGAYLGFSRTMMALGSGVFGPANADVSVLFSARKQNYLTSTQEGEILTQYLVNEQGRKGDAATILASTSKVKTGTSEDTGGALGYEFRAAFVDTAGIALNAVHSYSPYMAPTTDMSGGAGYGSYVESFNGTNFSAFTAGAYLDSNPSTGWRNVLLATADRKAANTYFRIRGSTGLERAQQPGDVVIGSNAPKTIRNSAGILQIRNAADNATLFEVSETGAVGFPSDPSWAEYSPTITCGAGKLAKSESRGAFKGFGKTINVRLEASIGDLGSCSDFITMSLPASAKATHVLSGSSTVSLKMLQGLTKESSSQIQILDYSGSFPVNKTDTIVLSGTFEAM